MELLPPLRLIIASRYSANAKNAWHTYQTNQAIDWPLLAQQARQTGLAPLLYDGLQKLGVTDVPPAIQTQLRQIYLDTALRNVHALHQLNAVLQALKSAAIPVIVLKGAALAQIVYGNVSLRPMADLDLLIPFARLAQAQQLVEALDFQLVEPLPFIDPSGLFWNEILLRRPGKQTTLLELHWHLIDNPYYANRPGWDELWARAWPQTVEGVDVHLLSPTDQLLHLCAHNYQHHLGLVAQAGPDMATLINHFPINWEEFVARAEMDDIVLSVQRTVQKAVADWFVPIPDDIVQRLAQLRPRRRESFFIFCQRSPYWKHVRSLVTLPSLRLKLVYVWGLIFPQRAYLEHRYQIQPDMPIWQAHLRRFARFPARFRQKKTAASE